MTLFKKLPLQLAIASTLAASATAIAAEQNTEDTAKDIEVIKAIGAIQVIEDIIRETQEKDLTPEDKLDLTKKLMFAMIDVSKHHLNNYYGKKVYNIRGIDNPRKGMEDVKIDGNVLEGIIGYEGNDLLK